MWNINANKRWKQIRNTKYKTWIWIRHTIWFELPLLRHVNCATNNMWDNTQQKHINNFECILKIIDPIKKKFVRSNPSKCSLEAFTHPHTRTFTFAKKPLGLQPSKSATTQVRMVCTSNVRTSCNLYINSSRFRQVIKHAVTPNVCENRSTNLCPSSLSPCQSLGN